MSTPSPPASARANERTETRVSQYRGKLLKAVQLWNLPPRELAWVNAILGLSGTTAHPRLSDLRLRRRASRLLIELLLARRAEASDNRVYLHITFIDESGNTSDREPEFNLSAFRKKVSDALRGSFDAVVQIEAQALTNYPLPARTIMLHAHAIGWIDSADWRADPDKKAQAWADTLNASGSWVCRFEAAPVVAEVIGDTDHDLARVAAYISKVPNNAKWRTGNPIKPLRSTTIGYRSNLALRLAEVLSCFLATDMLFGVGAGVPLAHEWRRRVRAYHYRRRATVDEGSAVEITAMWTDLRTRFDKRTRTYRKPFRILTGKARPRLIHPNEDGGGTTMTRAARRFSTARAGRSLDNL